MMIRQPKLNDRNITVSAYEMEEENLMLLNEVIGNTNLTPAEEQIMIWLAGWEKSTVRHIIDVFRKSLAGD